MQRFFLKASVILASLSLNCQLVAETFHVTSSSDALTPGTLRFALSQANAGDAIILDQGLGPIVVGSSVSTALSPLKGVNIYGQGNTISGADGYPIFVALSGTNKITNLTLEHGFGQGGAGGSGAGGGGGGLGAGGALFISSNAAVELTGITFSQNSVAGGNGGSVDGGAKGGGGGGGGYSSDGGSASSVAGAGGGGCFNSPGGSTSNGNGGGGGGGIQGSPGASETIPLSFGGGGGGGVYLSSGGEAAETGGGGGGGYVEAAGGMGAGGGGGGGGIRSGAFGGSGDQGGGGGGGIGQPGQGASGAMGGQGGTGGGGQGGNGSVGNTSATVSSGQPGGSAAPTGGGGGGGVSLNGGTGDSRYGGAGGSASRGGGGGGGGTVSSLESAQSGGAGGSTREGGGGGGGGTLAQVNAGQGGAGGSTWVGGGGGGGGSEATTAAGAAGSGGISITLGGGGGGGAQSSTSGAAGGDGGKATLLGGGGGGGSSLNGTGGSGGAGGLGGGGGGASAGATNGSPGSGGFGAGAGGDVGVEGGGGSALGGAVFLASGGSLLFTDGAFSGNTLGAAGTGSTSGSSEGSDLFLMSGTRVEFHTSQGMETTLDGAIGGSGGVKVSGAGKVQFSGVNSYTGATLVDSGTLALIDSASIAPSSAVTVNGTLDFTGMTAASVIQNLTGSGSVLLGADPLSILESTPTTFSGIIGGAGDLFILGSATMTLSGANTVTGTVGINTPVNLVGNGSIENASAVILDSTLDISKVNGGGASLNSLSGSGGAIVLGDNTLELHQDSFGVFDNGVISGTGALFIFGPGGLELNVPSTYTGETRIENGASLALTGTGSIADSGIVQVTGALAALGVPSLVLNNLVGSGTIELLVPGQVTLNQELSATFSGDIIGAAGSVVKTGAARLTLSGDNTYTGDTVVAAGALQVDGTLPNSNVTVNSGAILNGVGTLADVFVQGILTPGTNDGIGTIHLANLELMSGSELAVNISADGTNDLVSASGAVQIDAGSKLSILPVTGTQMVDLPFTLVEAGSVTGTFSTTYIPMPRYVLNSLTYTPTTVEINVSTQPFEDILPSTATSNAEAVAHYLDFLDVGGFVDPGSDLAAVFTALSYSTAAELAISLDTMHPATYNMYAIAQQDAFLEVNATYVNQLDELLTFDCERRRKPCAPHEWIALYGWVGRRANDGQNSGYAADMFGATWGLDRLINNQFCVGGALTYTQVYLNGNYGHDTGHVSSGYIGAYGRYLDRCFYADLSLTGGVSFYRTSRQIILLSSFDSFEANAHSMYNGLDFSAHAGVGRVFRSCFETALFASVDWVYGSQRPFTEGGADALNLVVAGRSENLVRSQVGCWISRPFCRFIPKVGVAVAYDARVGNRFDAAFIGEPGGLVVYGLNPSQFVFLPEISVASFFPEGKASLSIGYWGEYGDRYSKSNFSLSFGYNF